MIFSLKRIPANTKEEETVEAGKIDTPKTIVDFAPQKKDALHVCVYIVSS